MIALREHDYSQLNVYPATLPIGEIKVVWKKISKEKLINERTDHSK